MTATQVPTPGPLDWTTHDGSDVPIFNTYVDVMKRDGSEWANVHSGQWGQDWLWSDDDTTKADIVSWRLASLAPTAPVEASGSERDIKGETFMGFRVAAWRYRQGDETDKLPHHYAEHWSTPGASAWGIQRLFTEDQLQQALNLRPQPSGFIATLTDDQRAAALAHTGDDTHPQPSGETREQLAEIMQRNMIPNDDGGFSFHDLKAADEILALLSARPLALGGQQGEVVAYRQWCVSDKPHQGGWWQLIEKHDGDHAIATGGGKNLRPLYDTTPARAEAQDEGAAGERDKRAWIDRWNAIEGAAQDALHTMTELLEAPNLKRMQYALGERRDALASALNLPEAGTAWMRPAHPSPTPAADADRVRSALTDLVTWFDKPVQGERGMVWVIRAGDQGADDAVAEALAS